MGGDSSRQASERAALVASGRQLLGDGDTTGFSVGAVLRSSGLSEGNFRACFDTESHFRVAMIESLLDELRDEIVSATAQHPPGIARIRVSLESYLEGNLRRRALRALILEGRGDRLIVEMTRRRTHGYGMLMHMELAGLKVANPAAAGRFLAIMAVEIATAEYEARRAQFELRANLFLFLQRLISHRIAT